MKYYIKSNGKTYGPIEDGKIRDRVISGFFSDVSFLSTDLKEWIPIQQCMDIPRPSLSAMPERDQEGIETEAKPRVLCIGEENIVRRRAKKKPLYKNKIFLIAGSSATALLLVGGILFFVLSDSSDDYKPAERRHRSADTSITKKSSSEEEDTGKTAKNEKTSDTDSPKNFKEVYRKYQSAVGVVTVTLENSNGELLSELADYHVDSDYPIGTAFAIDKNKFVTNCHVAYGLRDQKGDLLEKILWKIVLKCAISDNVKNKEELSKYIKKNAEGITKIRNDLNSNVKIRNIEIRLAHSGGKTLSIAGVQIHPRYRKKVSSQEEAYKNGEFDFAILTTSEETDVFCKLASGEKLYNLEAGQEIAYIGFPMEGLGSNGNMDLNKPEAIFKPGTISKITDHNNVFSSKEMNRAIIHDIPSAGGASGSPIFLPDGEIVAVLWGGEVIGRDQSGARIVSSIQHNYATRIDSLDVVKRQKVRSIQEWTGEDKK